MHGTSKLFKKATAMALAGLLVLSSLTITPAHAEAENSKDDSAGVKITKPDKKMPDLLKKSNNLIKPANENQQVKAIVELDAKSLIQSYKNKAKSSLSTAKYLASGEAKTAKKKLLQKHDDVKKKISRDVKGASFKHTFDYTVALNGFSVSLPLKDLNKIKKIEGVKAVHRVVTYTLPPNEQTSATGDAGSTSSKDLIGADLANKAGYTGKKTVVAVIDSGLDTTHEAFNTMPEEDTLRYSKSAIADKVKGADLEASKITNISDNRTFVDNKVPYAFDYADKDTDVTGGVEHGTHVSGIVAGNNTAKESDPDKVFKGVAPDAQLMMMKVFANGSGSTSDDIILAGLEDAIKLGADAINMSLGSPAGFPDSGDSIIDQVYDSVTSSGINLNVAAGNETSSTLQNTTGVNLNPAADPDTGIVGSPSTYSSSLSVASSESSYFQSLYFTVGGEDGTKVPYMNAINVNNNQEIKIAGPLDKKTVDYVYLDKYGFPEDYDGIDVKGKVVVVKRGGSKDGTTIGFEQKAENAKAAGAVAVIVVNSEPGTVPTPGVTKSDIIPVIGVAQDAGKTLADAKTKTVYFSSSNESMVKNPGAGQISSFSSIGPSPNLGIKPEITAPGGNIYSSVNGNTYKIMSGTSMATPQLSGVAALLKQYVNGNDRFKTLSQVEKSELITNLEMSTAGPIKTGGNIDYPVRMQGAGLVNVDRAIRTPAYITVKGGRPKAELGSSSDGSWTVEFTINNPSDQTVNYTLDPTVLTGKLQDDKYLSTDSQQLSGDDVTVTGAGKLSVAPGAKKDVTVKIALSANAKQKLKSQFKNGIYVEGFLGLKSADKNGVALSLPFLGFYGDWNNLPLFDTPIYDGKPLSQAFTTLVNRDSVGNAVPLGVNSATTPSTANKNKIAFSPTLMGTNSYLSARLSLLRNAAKVKFQILDSSGKTVYWQEDHGSSTKNFYYSSSGTIISTQPTSAGWNGKDKSGKLLADNTKLIYRISATPVGSDKVQTVNFPVAIDRSAPTVSTANIATENGKTYLTVHAADNQGLQYLAFTDTSGHETVLPTKAFKGETDGTVKVDITDLGAKLRAGGYDPGRIAVYAYDYAYNNNVSYLQFGPSAITLPKAQEVKHGKSVTLSATAQPAAFKNTPIKWSVDNTKLATINQKGKVTAIKKGVVTVTATATATGLSATTKIYIDEHVPADSGVTKPDGKSKVTKPILDNQYGNLSVAGNHEKVPENLNQVFSVSGFTYRVIGNGQVELIQDPAATGTGATGYAKKSGVVHLPQSVTYQHQSYKLVTIGYKAFYNAKNITKVVVPEGVKVIGESAFQLDNQLTQVVLPASVKRIDDYAFNALTNTQVNIPANVIYIGDRSFSMNQKLTDVTLKHGLQEIGDEAFAMSSITKLSLPSGVKALGQNFLMSTAKLQHVTLPKDLKRIPKNAFYNSGITHIDLPANLEVIGYNAFQSSKLKSITIPAKVNRIEPSAFSLLNLTGSKLTIPDSVRIIGENAFQGTKADQIRVGANALRIDKDAFKNMSGNLIAANNQVAKQIRRSNYGGKIEVGGTEFTQYVPGRFVVDAVVYRPTGEKTAEVQGVNDQSSRTQLIIPEKITDQSNHKTYTVTSIASRVEQSNMVKTLPLEKLVLPDTIERVGERAFDQNLYVTSFKIPASLKEVGYQAFGYMGQQVKNWKGISDIPGKINDWEDCGFAGLKRDQVTLPKKTDYVNDYEFADSSLKTVTFNSSLKMIKTGAFMDNKLLASLHLTNGLEYIDGDAFNGTALTNINIPDSVKFIGSEAFAVSGGNLAAKLGGSVDSYGWNSFPSNAKIQVVLNSQLEDVVAFNSLKQLPTVKWDGRTSIYAKDGSTVPTKTNITISKDKSLTEAYAQQISKASTAVFGKLDVNGTLTIPKGQSLYVDGTLEVSGSIKGQGKLIFGKHGKAVLKGKGQIAKTLQIPASRIGFDNATMNLKVGQSTQLKPVLSPEFATPSLINYKVLSGSKSIKVTKKGKVTAIKTGTAIIIAYSASDSDVAAKIKVKVGKSVKQKTPKKKKNKVKAVDPLS